jgi:hypothetical protein
LKRCDDLIGAIKRQWSREPSEEALPKDIEIVIPDVLLFTCDYGQDDEHQ